LNLEHVVVKVCSGLRKQHALKQKDKAPGANLKDRDTLKPQARQFPDRSIESVPLNLVGVV
jgi:hypothetical protein